MFKYVLRIINLAKHLRNSNITRLKSSETMIESPFIKSSEKRRSKRTVVGCWRTENA